MQGALARDCSPPGQGWELWVVGRSSLVAEVPQPLPTESCKGPLQCGSHGILTPDGDWRSSAALTLAGGAGWWMGEMGEGRQEASAFQDPRRPSLACFWALHRLLPLPGISFPLFPDPSNPA